MRPWVKETRSAGYTDQGAGQAEKAALWVKAEGSGSRTPSVTPQQCPQHCINQRFVNAALLP